MLLPGPFYELARLGRVDAAAAAPLLAELPEEGYVRAPSRGGEAFDSLRWPVAWDVAVARFAASRVPDPTGEIAGALGALRDAGDRPAVLAALARRAVARSFAAAGHPARTFRRIWTDATAADLEEFVHPPARSPTLEAVRGLCGAHHAAAEGLYAYHVHRGVAGYTATCAADVVIVALDEGVLTVAEVVAFAVTLARAEASRRATDPTGA